MKVSFLRRRRGVLSRSNLNHRKIGGMTHIRINSSSHSRNNSAMKLTECVMKLAECSKGIDQKGEIMRILMLFQLQQQLVQRVKGESANFRD